MPKETDSSEPPRRKSIFRRIISRIKNSDSEISTSIESPTAEEEVTLTPQMQKKNEEFRDNFESFATKTVEEVMVPRSDIVAVSDDIEMNELSKVITEHNHTRTLVYRENLDKIIGFIHIKDLFEVLAAKRKFNIKKLTRKHLVSPTSMLLIDLLMQMQFKRTHIAVVVDEYGGTDGIVTIEDIMEAIVGPIDDEHDELDNDSFKIIKPGEILTSARVELGEIEKIVGVRLTEEETEFDTIGGLVLAKSGSVPSKGDIIELSDDVVVEVMDATPRTITQLKMTYHAKDSSE